jgi:hypothetical protein
MYVPVRFTRADIGTINTLVRLVPVPTDTVPRAKLYGAINSGDHAQFLIMVWYEYFALKSETNGLFLRFKNSVADLHHFDADPDPDLLFTLVQIRIRVLPFTLMRIRILAFQLKAQNLEKNAQIGSYSIHLGLSSAK